MLFPSLNQILNLGEEEKLTVCCLLWIWWAERNKSNVCDRIRSSEEVVSSISAHALEYKSLESKRPVHKVPVASKWVLRMINYFKINTDGAFHEESHSGGLGFIVRNDQGVPVAAGHGHIQGVSSALHAEALSLLKALCMTSAMECSRVQLEVDATNLKQAITS